MKARLVSYLACPDCGGDLALREQEREGSEILSGDLTCAACHHNFPIQGGVPRLLPSGLPALDREVADSFGWEWNQFDEIRPEYRGQFLDWLLPLTIENFRDKLVLEGGCGKGRHSLLVASFGAREVFSVDLGPAVEAAFRNTRHADAVHIIQGDIAHLPLKRCVDVAFSVGVLHHMPDPVVGFRALVSRVRDGGRVAVWVYGFESNEWIVHLVDPLRIRFTSKMPRRLLYQLSRPLAFLVAGAAKGVYRPLARTALHEKLFYHKYLTYIADLPLREIHSIVFDQLVTPVAHYLRRDEVAKWFEDPQFSDVHLAWHNENSWRATAVVGAQREQKKARPPTPVAFGK